MQHKLTHSMLITSLFVFMTSACNSENTSASQNTPKPQTITTSNTGTNTPATSSGTSTRTLDTAEEAHLVFMREEEKLARDVYMTLATLYPAASVFSNIGDGSEQTHTDMIRDQLEAYGVADPNPQTNDLPTSIGVYTGAQYGDYFTEKYTYLTQLGARSELDALYVGAFIEELDMHDIIECPDYIVESDNGIEECGMGYTDEYPLLNAYSSLVDGSKNHLRAFVGRIETIIGEGNYVAQVIDQEQVDEILGR